MQSDKPQQGMKQVITDREARKAVARLSGVLDAEDAGKCPGEAARSIYQTTCQETAEQLGTSDLKLAVRFLRQYFERCEKGGAS